MKDKQKLESIIGLFDSTLEFYDVKKSKFNKGETLRNKVTQNLRKAGKLGLGISKSLKRDYEDKFFWPLFYFFENWTIEENDDVSWDLLKGYSEKGTKHESLKNHRDILKRIWIAEFVLRRKNKPAPDIEKITKDKIDNMHYSGTKIIYTPMGNKR